MESSFPNLWGEQKSNEQKWLNSLTTGEQTWNKKQHLVLQWTMGESMKKTPPEILFHTLTKPYSEIKAFFAT